MTGPTLEGVRWILFDAVGTLIYPDPPVAAVYQSVARQFGSQRSTAEIGWRFAAAFASEYVAAREICRPTSEELERERWRRIVTAVLDDLPAGGGEAFEKLWTHFAQPTSWRTYSDVPAALAALTACGFRLGIASNFDSRLQAIAAAQLQLASCERVFVSSEIGFSKPNPQFFAAIERRLFAGGNELLLVGDDRVNDWEGATNAGWQALLVEREVDAPRPGRLQSLTQLIS